MWKRFRDVDTSEGAFDYSDVVPKGRWPFAVIGEDLFASGVGIREMVGAAESYLFDAAAVVRFGIDWIERKLATPPTN
ncbi:hypothetical protein JOD67_006748 [Tenggerimyces flavus]|nr:hypothetical protein [Tenggerimyces flavus]